jgi:type II secretory pathway predicted ATPase ExeA
MYNQFYNFSEKPFNLAPDPKFLYLTPSHREALAAMLYGVKERKGFVSITGEMGTGKTTLIYSLLRQTDAKVRTVYISHANITFEQLLENILLDLELPIPEGGKSAHLRLLNEYLIRKLYRDENLAIIIDEAQNLSKQVMEELRMLSNLETPKSKLLLIVLVGQPELEVKLDSEDLRQLKQRIEIRRQVHPLRRGECVEYINHRLNLVGSAASMIFTPEAISLICDYSKGIPRTINILCDNALLIGCALSQKKLDADIIHEVLDDLGITKSRVSFRSDSNLDKASHHEVSEETAPMRPFKPWTLNHGQQEPFSKTLINSKGEGEANEWIKGIKEAHEILKNPSPRKEIHQRRKERYRRKKGLMISIGVVLILMAGFFTFEMAQLTFQRKPAVPTAPTSVPEAERVTRPSRPLPGEMPKIPDQKSSQNIPEQIVESQEAISPVAESPKKELEPKEKIAKEPVKIEKPIPKEVPKPASEKRPKVEEPKAVSTESRPAIPYVPLSEESKKPEVVIANEREKPKPTPKEVPKDVNQPLPKEASKTTPTQKTISAEMSKPEVSKSFERMPQEKAKVEERKPVSKEPLQVATHIPVSESPQQPEVTTVTEKEKPKAAPEEVPKEISRVLPKEAPKSLPQQPPLPQTSRAKEVKPPSQTSDVAEIPSPKPAAPVAAIPPMPHPFVKENEVKQFLAKYVDRYIQRDIEGFLAFFSPMAIQNQKDGIEEIRKIYSRQFELYEKFNYQLKNQKIEILEKSVKVKASYEIEQFSKKGETRRLRGEIEWDLVKEGRELKILAIQYRTIK